MVQSELLTEAPEPAALVIGESVIDIVENDRDRSARGSSEHLGGSGANVALALARLGHPVSFLTHLGDDARGRRFLHEIGGEGVLFTADPIPGERTSTAHAVIGDDGAARYVFDLEWSIAATNPAGYSSVHFGSLGLFLSPGAEQVLRTVSGTAGTGTIVTLDPNIRADLLPDHAEAVTRFEEAVLLSHLVKLSDEDLVWLYPEHDIDAAVQRILAFGASRGRTRAVIVTLGERGALAVTERGTTRVPAVPTTVIDTIGAGDSFTASLISSLLEAGLDGALAHPAALLERAARVSAFVVARAGSRPPRRSELV